jgi:hypothetical protein
MENLKAGIQVIRNRVDFQSHSKTLLFERIAGNEGVVKLVIIVVIIIEKMS